MNNLYDLHSWSKQYRRERMAEVQDQYLAQRDGSRSRSASLLLVTLVLAAILFGASACTDSASSSVDADSASSSNGTSKSDSVSASASPSSTSESASATASSNSDDSSSASSSASASASSSTSASASSDASASASSSSSDTDASNYAGMRSSSMECYTFYSGGTVELRHGGTSTVSDSGSYQGAEDFGEIVWDSGRWTSTVVAEGDGLIIDDLSVSPVERCF